MKAKSPYLRFLPTTIFAPVTEPFKPGVVCLATTMFFCASIAQGATLFSQTAKIGRSGGTLGSLKADAVVTVAPGAFTRQSPVTLRVNSTHRKRVLGDGFLISPHGVTLRLNPDVLSCTATLTVTLPFAGAYDASTSSATTMMVETRDGRRLAVPSTRMDDSHLTGRLDAATIRSLDPHSKDHGRIVLRLFTANDNLLEAGTLVTSVQPFLNNAFQPNVAVPPLSGRVAVCVHGIYTDISDLALLGGHLASVQQAGSPYYDYVIGFQYTSNVPLKEIGTALATSMQNILGPPGITQVDVYAHSMGNLVSRWAIEQGNGTYRIGPLRGGGHYVSLGGPHAGIPLGDLSIFAAFVTYFPTETRPLLMDLATNGRNGPPTYTTFLTDLNPANSLGPDYASAHYYSVSASNYLDELPIGPPIDFLYYLAVPPSGVVDDGLVAIYSAQNPVLGRESQTWYAGPTLDIGHHDLVTPTKDPRTNLSSFDVIDQLIASWN